MNEINDGVLNAEAVVTFVVNNVDSGADRHVTNKVRHIKTSNVGGGQYPDLLVERVVGGIRARREHCVVCTVSHLHS